MDVEFKLDAPGGAVGRMVEIRIRDETVLEVSAGAEGGPGRVLLDRDQALLFGGVLKAMGRTLKP